MENQAISDRIVTLFESVINETPQMVPNPPKELVDFRSIDKNKWSIEGREKEEKKFYSQVFIQEYLENKWKIELHNRDCFMRLYDLLNEEKDEIKIKALKTVMKKFQYAIMNTSHSFAALAIERDVLFFDLKK